MYQLDPFRRNYPIAGNFGSIFLKDWNTALNLSLLLSYEEAQT